MKTIAPFYTKTMKEPSSSTDIATKYGKAVPGEVLGTLCALSRIKVVGMCALQLQSLNTDAISPYKFRKPENSH